MSNLDLQRLRAFLARLPSVTIVDFEENIQLPSVLATLRTWEDRSSGEILAFAYVDDFDNLWFETAPLLTCQGPLEKEIIEWGVHCIRERYPGAVERTLDTTCDAGHPYRIQMLLEHGFLPQETRTLRYARSLNEPIPECPLPGGFSIRHTTGEQEVEQLVALHRSAFGTDNMTVGQRLALMRSPQYVRDMDLVVVAPDGELAAFCVCGFEDREKGAGYTDPIGTSARFQRRGLGRAVLAHGLRMLKSAGAVTAGLGTSSQNIAMQKLAESGGFACISEKLWFSKSIV